MPVDDGPDDSDSMLVPQFAKIKKSGDEESNKSKWQA